MNRPVRESAGNYCFRSEMKKVLFVLLSLWILFACSEEREIPVVNPDSNGSTKPERVDSIYYQLDVDGFELVAASKDSTYLFLQTDTTFAFSCLFDSCNTNRLVAYCDSTGMVERIVADNQVVNILHHEDKKKMDIFYEDSEGKLAWIKDVESPYKDASSRTEAGDVPYSAISIVNDLSYAVYTIINTYDIYKISKRLPWKYTNKYVRKETYNMRGTVALKLIKQILGKEYKIVVFKDLAQIVTVMSDYSKWVKEELYGDAVPHLRKYAIRQTINGMTLTAYVTGVDSLKNEFMVGVIVSETEDKLDAFHFLNNQGSQYNSQYINYLLTFSKLQTGKNYKFRPYLAPTFTSKYSKGMKGLLDYYKYGTSHEHLLLEAKTELQSTDNDVAMIQLTVENAKRKMGIIYSEYNDLLKHEYKKIEIEPTTEEIIFPGNFEREIRLSYLKSGKVYYMPYVIYDDNIINRFVYSPDTIISTAIIDEKDFTFYGKQGVFDVILNPITHEAIINGRTFRGYFVDPNYAIEKGRSITEVVERGFIIKEEIESKSSQKKSGNYPDVTVENATAVKATNYKDGKFEVSTELNENATAVYYRAYIKMRDRYYYGEVKKCTKESLRDALVKLYQSTNGDNWTHNDNWCSDKPVTEWYGVKKKGDNEYTLLLTNNNLTGKIEQTFPDDVDVILSCADNQLTSLNVSGCTALTSLGCSNNQLVSLNVSGCTALTFLSCTDNNQLTSLDVSGCTALTTLYCWRSQLTSLDASGCTALTLLSCYGNQLTSLDVAGCIALEELFCTNNQLTFLDVSSCTALKDLSCFDNRLTSLDVSNCTALEDLVFSDNQLTSLDVSSCTALEDLICSDNQLTSLDVSGCMALTRLFCDSNQLTSLDVSGYTTLTTLSCYGNQLTSLDVSGCMALKEFYFSSNPLISLDVSGCTALTTLSLSYCGNQLTSLDVSGCTALTTLLCSSNQLTSLDVSGCIALKELSCGSNQLTSLDVSSCIALKELSCSYNQLTSLDVSSCTALTRLSCGSNQLTSLDVSSCMAMNHLTCSNNRLTSLNVSSCTALEWLLCENNNISNVIPEWFSQLKYFSYDRRYEYWNVPISDGQGGTAYIIKYKDQGKGWWYSGEPEKGNHAPN